MYYSMSGSNNEVLYFSREMTRVERRAEEVSKPDAPNWTGRSTEKWDYVPELRIY